MLAKVFVIFLIASIVNAETFMEKLPEIPAALSDRKGCYLKAQNMVLPFGKTFPGDYCTLISCTPHAISYQRCDTPVVDDPRCKVVNLKKGTSYPECCPEIQCD